MAFSMRPTVHDASEVSALSTTGEGGKPPSPVSLVSGIAPNIPARRVIRGMITNAATTLSRQMLIW
jgi:hypothetical protein